MSSDHTESIRKKRKARIAEDRDGAPVPPTIDTASIPVRTLRPTSAPPPAPAAPPSRRRSLDG